MSSIDVWREIAQNPITTARVLPDSHRDRFSAASRRTTHHGYIVDAATLVRDWDGLVRRAERAESENEQLRATIAALTSAITAHQKG